MSRRNLRRCGCGPGGGGDPCGSANCLEFETDFFSLFSPGPNCCTTLPFFSLDKTGDDGIYHSETFDCNNTGGLNEETFSTKWVLDTNVDPHTATLATPDGDIIYEIDALNWLPKCGNQLTLQSAPAGCDTPTYICISAALKPPLNPGCCINNGTDCVEVYQGPFWTEASQFDGVGSQPCDWDKLVTCQGGFCPCTQIEYSSGGATLGNEGCIATFLSSVSTPAAFLPAVDSCSIEITIHVAWYQPTCTLRYELGVCIRTGNVFTGQGGVNERYSAFYRYDAEPNDSGVCGKPEMEFVYQQEGIPSTAHPALRCGPEFNSLNLVTGQTWPDPLIVRDDRIGL